jgi:glycosyltransferase involved in cell wall biosynthesis
MKILFLFPGALYPPTGDSIRSQDVATKLAQLGNDVEFYCFEKNSNVQSKSTKLISPKELLVYEGITVKKILKNFLFQKVLSKLASVQNISYDFLPLGVAGLSPFLPFYLRSKLTKVDLMWVEGGFGNLFLVLFSHLFGKSFVFSNYGGIKKGLRQLLLQKITQLTCALSDIVITTSESEKHQLMSNFNLTANKVIALPDSVDQKFLEPPTTSVRKLYGIKNDEIIILFMGNLASNHNLLAAKNIMNVYIPFLQNNLKGYGFHFFVVGPKPTNFPFESNSYVTFTGYVDNPQDYVHDADICLAPVYGIGGLHVKVLAYMTCGKAIITSPEGAKPLGLRDGVDALVADSDGTFASKIMTLINDEELRCRLSKNSEQRIREMEQQINNTFRKLQTRMMAQVAKI